MLLIGLISLVVAYQAAAWLEDLLVFSQMTVVANNLFCIAVFWFSYYALKLRKKKKKNFLFCSVLYNGNHLTMKEQFAHWEIDNLISTHTFFYYKFIVDFEWADFIVEVAMTSVSVKKGTAKRKNQWF